MGPKKFVFISLFSLPKVNHFVYHLLNSCTAVTGLGLVYSIFMIMNLKFRQHAYDNYQFIKLYLAVLYGFISNLVHLTYGAIFFMDGVEAINQLVHKEIHISLYEFLFYLQIFFSVLFGIFTTLLTFTMKAKPSYSIETQEQEEQTDYKWINYRILILIYLAFFLTANILVVLHNNGVIFTSYDSVLLKSNYAYLIAFLPYALYLLNLGLYSMFYGELKNTYVSMASPAEKINYEHHHKNIL